MEIQLGFRLSSVQELRLLAEALSLVGDTRFAEYVRLQNVLPTLGQQEVELNRRIQELMGRLNVLEDYEKLRNEVEALRAERDRLVSQVGRLQAVIGQLRSLAQAVEQAPTQP